MDTLSSKMDVEKECSLLGTLFQSIVTDLKGSSPAWEEFVTRGTKLHTLLKSTTLAVSAFVESIQKIADAATNTKGSTKDIGTALTRICVRQKMVENKLKYFTNSLSENLLLPIQERLEEWKKVSNQLEKDHAKEYKKAMHDIKKRNTDTLRLQKKARKASKGDLQFQLNSAMHEVNERLSTLEETEKSALRNLLVEERSRICLFGNSLAPVLDLQISMMNECNHLHELSKDVAKLCRNPKQLPTSTEQLVQDFICANGQTQVSPSPLQDAFQLSNGFGSFNGSSPPSSPKSSDSRKSSMCSLNSINSSDSRSSGSLNHNTGSTFHHRYQGYHRRNNSSSTNNTGQGSPTSCKSAPAGVTVARLSSVSSHDSGFVPGMNAPGTFPGILIESKTAAVASSDMRSTHSSEGMSPVIRSRPNSGQIVDPAVPTNGSNRPLSWKDWSRPGPYDSQPQALSSNNTPSVLPSKPFGPPAVGHKPFFTPHRLSTGDFRENARDPAMHSMLRHQSEPQFFSPNPTLDSVLKSPTIPPKPSNFVFPLPEDDPLPPPPPLDEDIGGCETPVADEFLPPPPPSLMSDLAFTPQNEVRHFVPPRDEAPLPRIPQQAPGRIPDFSSMTLGRKNSNHSLQYSSSSGYSSRNTTPACSEDTIASHDTDYGSLNGDEQHATAHAHTNYEMWSTMPRSRDGRHGSSHNRRPASTSGMPSQAVISTPITTPGTATIRRKPSSKFNSIRRSSNVPKPVQPPTVPGSSLSKLMSTFVPPDDMTKQGRNDGYHYNTNNNGNSSVDAQTDAGVRRHMSRNLTLKFGQAPPLPEGVITPSVDQRGSYRLYENGVAPLSHQ